MLDHFKAIEVLFLLLVMGTNLEDAYRCGFVGFLMAGPSRKIYLIV
jgi:hypothetical protein